MLQGLFIPVTTTLFMLGITFLTLNLDNILHGVHEIAQGLYDTLKRSTRKIRSGTKKNEEVLEMKTTDIEH